MNGVQFTDRSRLNRLFGLDDIENWCKTLNFLRLAEIEFFRFARRASLRQLLDKAERKHYSTFSLYTADGFRHALQRFQEHIRNHFTDLDDIRWSDENIMLVFRKS